MLEVNADKREHQTVHKSGLYYGWVIVGVAFLTLGIAFGVWYSFSVFFLAVINDFGWSRAAASSVFSVFIISQSFVGPLTGHLQDRFGPRLIIPIGALLVSASLVIVSRASSLWEFYVFYGVCAGVGVSLMGFSSHSAFIPKWFERKRGLAIGIAMSGIGLGMLLIIPLVERGIALLGWRRTYLCLAGLVLGVIVPLNLLFGRKSPAEMNLVPDGNSVNDGERLSKPAFTVKIVDPGWAGEDWTLRKALGTKRFWFLLGSFFFGSWVYQGTLLHCISAMVDSGVTRENAAYYFGIVGIAGSAGKILFGYLSDVIGREKANSLAGLITALGIICLIFIPAFHGPMPLLFALSFGLGYGAAAPLFPSVSADIFLGSSFGLIFAAICMGGGLGGSLGPYVAGLIRDVTGTYTYAFELSFLSLACSCLFIWLARPSNVRRLIKSW
jgi:MFS family permease